MQEERSPMLARSNQRRGRKRRLLVIVLIACLGMVLSLTIAPQVFAAATRNAAPLCSAQGCNGKDPYASFCAGQPWDSWSVVLTTPVVSQEYQPIGYVQLWWSNTCKTNWARLVIQVPHTWMQVVVGDDARGDPVFRRTSTTPSHATGVLLSPQLYAPIAGAAARGDAVPLSDGRITTACVDQENGQICSWLPL